MHNRPVSGLDRDEAGRRQAVLRERARWRPGADKAWRCGVGALGTVVLGLDWPVLHSPLGPLA